MEAFWGPEVKLSKVITKKKKFFRRGENQEQDTGHSELDAHRSYAIRHIDYQASMVYKGLTEILASTSLLISSRSLNLLRSWQPWVSGRCCIC